MLPKKFERIVLGLSAVIAAGFFSAPYVADLLLNTVTPASQAPVSNEGRALHDNLTIMDFHADSLLWKRDPATRHGYGHIDLPRLRDGGVAIQTFAIVTKTPRSMNYDVNSADGDNITIMAVASLWPWRSWGSLAERTLYQAERLRQAEAVDPNFVVLRSSTDLERFLANRKDNRNLVAGLIAIEGAHALDDDLANLDRFWEAGIRMVSLSHFFDNALAGSAHGAKKGGLTPMGRELIRRLESKKMILDLSHASPQAFDEALALTTRPVVVSHTGVKGTCPNVRNLSDAQLQAVARNGGLVAIGFWDVATCGHDAAHIAKAIAHAVKVMGIDHVGLGSDFDGTIEAPFDVTGLSQITDALMGEGLLPADIAKIMGGNGVALLQKSL